MVSALERCATHEQCPPADDEGAEHERWPRSRTTARVPRSQSVRRSTSPITTVVSQSVTPVLSAIGSRRTLALAIQPTSEADEERAAMVTTRRQARSSRRGRSGRPRRTPRRSDVDGGGDGDRAIARRRASIVRYSAARKPPRAPLENTSGMCGSSCVAEVDDAADDEVVVAELELVLDGAVDPRPDALDDRAAGGRVRPRRRDRSGRRRRRSWRTASTARPARRGAR